MAQPSIGGLLAVMNQAKARLLKGRARALNDAVLS